MAYRPMKSSWQFYQSAARLSRLNVADARSQSVLGSSGLVFACQADWRFRSMMRLRLLLAGAFAVSAVSGFAAGPASALSPCIHEPSGTHVALCVEEPGQSPVTLLLFSTNTTFAGVKEPGTEMSLVTPDLGADITCESATSSGTLEPSGVSTGLTASKIVVTYEGKCEDSADSAECEVKEPITTKELSATLSLLSNGSLDVLYKPATGTTFTTVTIKSKTGFTCGSSIERAKVSGFQLCEGLGLESEPDGTFQLLACAPSGSEMTFGGDPTEFEAAGEVSLSETAVKEWLWDIISGT
jgi:hypothetical protein